jgi:hypothetical protein
LTDIWNVIVESGGQITTMCEKPHLDKIASPLNGIYTTIVAVETGAVIAGSRALDGTT